MEWINAPGAWTFIVALIILGWLLASLFVDSGLAWTFVHLGHGVITYYLLHWNKGSPVQMDQVRLVLLSPDSIVAFCNAETCSRSPYPGMAGCQVPFLQTALGVGILYKDAYCRLTSKCGSNDDRLHCRGNMTG